MHSNTFGRLFRLTTYGESHGPGIGGVVDGCPAGLPLCEEDIQKALDERRPGADGKGGAAGSPRNEKDRVRLLSGIFEGKTTGTPIAFHVDNTDAKPSDYAPLADTFRPGHADLPWHIKYGGLRDYRGGGRASGRETLARVAGGAVAAKFLRLSGISFLAYTLEFGGFTAHLSDVPGSPERKWFSPDPGAVAKWDAIALSARNEGDSLGGRVRVEIYGLPPGLGEPVFDRLDARLAYALMGVGAVKGVEIGRGFEVAHAWGSDNNDPILPAPGRDAPDYVPAEGALPSGAGFGFGSNNAGGILGGLSTGAPVVITAAVKPIASIARTQKSITLSGGEHSLNVTGRHDASAIPRVVPVLKAMAALTVADFLLLQRSACL